MYSKRAITIFGSLLLVVAGLSYFLFGTREIIEPADDTRSLFHSVESALASYQVMHGCLPTTAQGLNELVTKKIMTTYPLDGWRRPVIYLSFSCESYVLLSLGEDGIWGGNGRSQDILFEKSTPKQNE